MKGSALFIILWIVFGLFVGGFLFDYSFCFWAGMLKGAPVHIPLIVALLGGVVLRGLNLPIAILTWICSFVL